VGGGCLVDGFCCAEVVLVEKGADGRKLLVAKEITKCKRIENIMLYV